YAGKAGRALGRRRSRRLVLSCRAGRRCEPAPSGPGLRSAARFAGGAVNSPDQPVARRRAPRLVGGEVSRGIGCVSNTSPTRERGKASAGVTWHIGLQGQFSRSSSLACELFARCSTSRRATRIYVNY